MIVGKASGRGYVRYKNREAIYFVTNLVDLGFHRRSPGPHIRASRNANFLPGSPLSVVEAPRLAKRNRGMSALGHFRQMGAVPTLTGCPLRSNSGHAHACHDMSA